MHAGKLSAGVAAIFVLWQGAALARDHGRIRLAQSSVTTTCMMTCNSQAANCQTTCVLPSTATGAAGTTTSAAGTPNATASVSCLSSCTSQQLACQTNCARTSPSQ